MACNSENRDDERRAQNVVKKVEGFTIYRMPNASNIPGFYDLVCCKADQDKGVIYLYGGDKRNEDASNQIFVLKVATMCWKKVDPKGVGIDADKPLPTLVKPAAAIYRTGVGRSIFLLFGGVDATSPECETSNKLVAVDIEAAKWFWVDLVGGEVRPRVNASMVTIKDKLFIFSGRTRIEEDAEWITSYCIAEMLNHRWTWLAKDKPYHTAFQLEAGFDNSLVPIYGGDKILLGAGRRFVRGHMELKLQHDRFFVFDVADETFSTLPNIVGLFPGHVGWYVLQQMDTDVLMAAWVNYNTEFFVPDIWRYRVLEKRIERMDIGSGIWDLDVDLSCCVHAEGRVLFLGHDDGVYKSDGRKRKTKTIPKEEAQFNVVVEVDMEYYEHRLQG